MIRNKVKCPHCGREISKSNIGKHIGSHLNGNFDKIRSKTGYIVDHDDLFCKFCGKECRNKNGLAQHEIRCKENPNKIALSKGLAKHRQKIASGEIDIWNKGLTKNTDERVRKNSESAKATLIKKCQNGWKPTFATEEFWTEERKKQKSQEKRRYYSEHPEKHPNRLLANNKTKIPKSEKETIKLLDNLKIKYIHNYYTKFEKTYRWVDFYLPEYNLYIELDGEYWHRDKKVDIAKDKYAKEVQGIETLRIDTDKDNYIEIIKNTLNNAIQ